MSFVRLGREERFVLADFFKSRPRRLSPMHENRNVELEQKVFVAHVLAKIEEEESGLRHQARFLQGQKVVLRGATMRLLGSLLLPFDVTITDPLKAGL